MSSKVLHLTLMVDGADNIQLPRAGDEIVRILNHPPVGPRFRYLGGSVYDFVPPKWVRITPTRYRGEPGFTVSDSNGQRIFTKTRASADRIKQRIRAGEDTRAEDWLL